jgi:hypothetical protein
MFREVCERSVAPDGIVFDAASIRVAQIRPEDAYGGQRVTLVAHLGPARIRVQIDVGIGDAVVPEPEWIDYPALLDLPRPRLRAYRKETAIAEKAQAIVALGLRNSRMRDFFDVRELALRETFEGTTLSSAISATFDRRHTAIPATLPLALSDEFASDAETSAQWAAYMNLIGRQADRGQFGSVIDDIRQFLFPVFRALSIGEPFQMIWSRSGPWSNPETPR